jgi:hypothetical protein
MAQVITRDSLSELLENSSMEKLKKIVGLICYHVFLLQTRREQKGNFTATISPFGFTRQDAHDMSISAKTYRKSGAVAEWVVKKYQKENGPNALVKYAEQLNTFPITQGMGYRHNFAKMLGEITDTIFQEEIKTPKAKPSTPDSKTYQVEIGKIRRMLPKPEVTDWHPKQVNLKR